MSDKSFGDHINRNIVKNPLLSSAVTGLSLDDLTHKAVLLPAATQGHITRLDESEGSQPSTLAYADHDKPSNPSGDAFANISLSNTLTNTPANTNPILDRQNYEKTHGTVIGTQSKASVKSEDDFDVNEYIARLQGTRYVSAPLNSNLKEENANLDAEETLEEINLNERQEEVQQSLTADIAQNFSQLPTVLPHMASAVFSSFSNMLSMRSHEQTPDGAKTAKYEGIERTDVGVPLMGAEESARRDIGLPPTEPPISGVSSYRIASKKKYAQIPGLSYGGVQNLYHNTPPVVPVSNLPPMMPQNKTLDRCKEAIPIDNANSSQIPYFTPAANEFKTVETPDKAYSMNTYFVGGNDNVSSDISAGIVPENRNASIMDNTAIQLPENASNLSETKDKQATFVTPNEYKDITTPRLPIIPPPPMFSNPRNNQQSTVGKSVLPPSVARRISANQPIIKPQTMQTPLYSENILVPVTIPEVSDPLKASGMHTLQSVTQDIKQSVQPPLSDSVPSQTNPVPFYAPSAVPSSVAVPFFATHGMQTLPPSNPNIPSNAQPNSQLPFDLCVTSHTNPPPSEIPSSVGAPFSAPVQRPPPIGTVFSNTEVSPFGTTGVPNIPTANITSPSMPFDAVPVHHNRSKPSDVIASNAPPLMTGLSNAPSSYVPMFAPTQIPPTLFIPTQAPHDSQPITQMPSLTPEPIKPLAPPTATGKVNFRMTKKRPQYYAGPIEGVGDISNNVKPVIAPVVPSVPDVDSSLYQGSLFTPEQKPQPAESFTASNVDASVPFDINRPIEPLAPYAQLEAKHQQTPYGITQQSYAQGYNTVFDLSRPNTEEFEPPKQEAKGFGIIGSLKSKLSSIDINKIQSTVTTFFDPAYNEAKGEPALETAPYAQQQYGQYSQEQSHFEISVPNVEQNQHGQYGYQHGHKYDQDNQYYHTQNVYNYAQNERQNISNYFTEPNYAQHTDNPGTNTQYTSIPTNYIQENIPHNLDNLSSHVEENKNHPDVATFFNPASIQGNAQLQTKIVYSQPSLEKSSGDIVTPYVNPNVGSHGAIGDNGKISINPPIVATDPNIGKKKTYKHFTDPVPTTSFFDNPTKKGEIKFKTLETTVLNAAKDSHIDIAHDKTQFSAPLPPAMSFFDSPSVSAHESRKKTVDLVDEMEKLALAEEIAIASSPIPAVNMRIGADSKVIETSTIKSKAIGQNISTIAQDKSGPSFTVIKKECESDQQGKSLIETLSKDTIPIVAVSNVPLFGLSAIIAEKTQEKQNEEKELKNIPLFDAYPDTKSQLEKKASFSFFENLASDDQPKAPVGLSIADVKNVLLIEPPQENLGAILKRNASSSLLKDLPEAAAKLDENLTQDRDSTWNLDTAIITSKSNVNLSFDKKASGFFDHLMSSDNLLERTVQKDDTHATEHASDFNICETCREVTTPVGKETDNVTRQLIDNINSSVQLLNPVEALLSESNLTSDERAYETLQYDDINQITEDTIETLQGQAATDMLHNVATSNNQNYGWTTEQLAYASIAAIDKDLIDTSINPKFDFKDDEYNAINPEYTFKIDPNTIGLFGDNSLFFDNVPNNASDEINAEFKTHEDVPQQITMTTAPPTEEDTKSDETGGLDVNSIEQDAKKDFPLEEEFIIEPSETDDDKIEYRERKKSSEDPGHDTFTDRIEKFQNKTGPVFMNDDITYQKGCEFGSPPKSMASYFDTGNYAAETHYKNSLTSPTGVNALQETANINYSQEKMRVFHVKPETINTFDDRMRQAPDELLRLPPGFEDELRRQYTEHYNSDHNKKQFIPETCTQTRTTITPTLATSHLNYTFVGCQAGKEITGPWVMKDSDETTKENIVDVKFGDETVARPVDIEHGDTSIEHYASDNIDIKTSIETPMIAKAFGSHDHTSFGGNILVEHTPKAPVPENTLQRIPDAVNFFSNIEEPKPTEPTQPTEGFSRLASYFSMPPAQPDHSKSFFELSQSQNHYRHVTNPQTNSIQSGILSQGQVAMKTRVSIQNLMHDLTSTQNLNFDTETVQIVNSFSVEYDCEPAFSKVDNLNSCTNNNAGTLDSLKFNSQNTQDHETVENTTANDKNDPKIEIDSSNDDTTEINNIKTINECRYCCNVKIKDAKNFKVRTAVDSDNKKESDADMNEKEFYDQKKIVTVDIGNNAIEEESQDGVTVLNESRTLSEYTPVRHHWFYRVDIDEKSVWRGFSATDSNALEHAYLSPDLGEDTLIQTDGGRFDVNIIGRLRIAVYWKEKPTNVRRCSWFYKGTTDARYVPYTEAVADKLEEEYRHGVTTGEWHRRLVLPNSELVVMHGPAVMVHFLHGGGADTFSSPPQSTSRPRVVRRGHEESEIEDPEPSSIDHLLLLCHGVGSACDMRFRPVEEVVEDFRSTSLQLLQSHYRNSYDNGVVSRVEVLPISWHAQLHVGEGGVDKRLNRVTLDSIPRLRAFTNHTVLDALFYTSPVYHQTIIDTVCYELNRVYDLFKKRNPNFKGGISLGGHSLGSVILYDLLCHQTPETPVTLKSSAHKSYLPGSKQPLDNYPQLKFPPSALYALGSPIAIFECIRGVEALGMDFALPTCKNFFNIFHPYDPIAYRIEPLINPTLQDVKPFLIPHHKGRKRMHLELKDTMVRVGADLKQKLIESLRTTWNKWKSSPPPDGQLEKVVEEEIEKEQLCEETKYDQNNAELISPVMLGRMNGGRRIDYVLQEAPLEMINEYIFAMSSHVGYWESEDTMLLILREVYSSLGVEPDCTVPQQSMTVTRTRQDEATIVNEKDHPSTSRGS